MAGFPPAQLPVYQQIVADTAIETGKIIAEIDANLPFKSNFDYSGQQAAAFKVLDEQKQYQKLQLYPLAGEFSSTGNMWGRPASPAEVQDLLKQFQESIKWYKQAAEQASQNSTYSMVKGLITAYAKKLGEVGGSISKAISDLGIVVKEGYDSAVAPEAPRKVEPPPKPDVKPFPWGWVIGGTVGVIAIGAGIYWFMQNRRRAQLTAPLQGVVLPHRLALAPKRRRSHR